MGLKDCSIIPSYKRPDTLKNKTLKVLQRYKKNQKDLVLFADKEQEKIYREALPKGSEKKGVGIKNIRNFMPKYFPEVNTSFTDDDIYKIYDTYSTNKSRDKSTFKQRELKSLKDLVLAFKLCEKSKITTGCLSVNNPFFMKARTGDIRDYVSTNLCYIIGFMMA